MKKAKQSLKDSTVAFTEEAAFEMYKAAQEEAFKTEGMLGVIQLGHFAIQESEKIAAECEKQGLDHSMTTGVVCGHLAGTWLPTMLEGMAKASDLNKQKEGMDKMIAELPDTPHPEVEAYVAKHGKDATLGGFTETMSRIKPVN